MRAQPEIENVLRQEKAVQHRSYRLEQILGARCARGRIVDPVAARCRRMDFRLLRSATCQLRCWARRPVGRFAQRRVLEAVEQVVAQRSLEHRAVRRGVAHAPADGGFRHGQEVMRAEAELAAVGPDQPRKGFRQRLRATGGGPHDRHRLPALDLQRHALEERRAAIVGDGEIDDRQRIGERTDGSTTTCCSFPSMISLMVNCSTTCWYFTCTSWRAWSQSMRSFSGPADLVGGDDGHQLADVQPALQREIAAIR